MRFTDPTGYSWEDQVKDLGTNVIVNPDGSTDLSNVDWDNRNYGGSDNGNPAPTPNKAPAPTPAPTPNPSASPYTNNQNNSNPLSKLCGVLLIGATIGEDFATLGAGVTDDAVSIAMGLALLGMALGDDSPMDLNINPAEEAGEQTEPKPTVAPTPNPKTPEEVKKDVEEGVKDMNDKAAKATSITSDPWQPPNIQPAGEEPPPGLGGKVLWAIGKILEIADNIAGK